MQSLPPLPTPFWTLFEAVLEEWRRMNGLLQREWKALEMGKINLLPGLADEKEQIGRAVAEVETRLLKTMERIIAMAGKGEADATPRQIIDEFRGVVNPVDVQRFGRLLVEWRLARQEAQAQNERHIRFIQEKMKLGRKLMNILTGAAKQPPLTYSPGGAAASNPIPTAHKGERRVSIWLA